MPGDRPPRLPSSAMEERTATAALARAGPPVRPTPSGRMAPVSLTVLGPRDVVGVMDAFRRGLAEPPGHHQPAERLPGSRRRHRHEHAAHDRSGRGRERSTGRPPAASRDMAEVCRAIAHGSLMGARGNSGVILCQILRGLAGTFAEAPKVGGDEVVAGLAGGALRPARRCCGRPRGPSSPSRPRPPRRHATPPARATTSTRSRRHP